MHKRLYQLAALTLILGICGVALVGCGGLHSGKNPESANGSKSAAPSFDPKQDPRYGPPGTPRKTPYRSEAFVELDSSVFPRAPKQHHSPPKWVKRGKSCLGWPTPEEYDKLNALVYEPTKPTSYIGFGDINDARTLAVMSEGDNGVFLWNIKTDKKQLIKSIEKDVMAKAIMGKTGILIRETWDCGYTCSKYRVYFYRFKDKSVKLIDDYTKRPDTPVDTPNPDGYSVVARIGDRFYWLRGVAGAKHKPGKPIPDVTASQLVEYNPDTDKVRIVVNDGAAASITPVGKWLIVPTIPAASSPNEGTQQWALLNPKNGSLYAVPPRLNEIQRYTNVYNAGVAPSGASAWVDPIHDPESIVWYSFDGYSKPIKILNNNIIHNPPIVTKKLIAIGSETGGYVFDIKTGKGIRVLDDLDVAPFTNSSGNVVIYKYPSKDIMQEQTEFAFNALTELDGEKIYECEPAVTPSKSGWNDPKSHKDLPAPSTTE